MKREKLLPECLQQTNTGDGGKVGISGFGTTAAKIYKDNMNGQLYCDTLQMELKHSLKKIPKQTKVTHQQDLAPWHTSDIVKDKIAKLKLTVLDWVPKSPDLNPIEMLWSILDKLLTSRPIYSSGSDGTASRRMGQHRPRFMHQIGRIDARTNTKVFKGKRWTFHVNKIVFVLIILKIN